MSNRISIVLAAALILVAHAATWLAARSNRAAATGGTLELTDHELRLQPMAAESSVVLLDPVWTALGASPPDWHAPEWLDSTKLTTLGFDCTVPVNDPKARRHYRSMRPVVAFVVLALRSPDVSAAVTHHPPHRSRLMVVDAGMDPQRLRREYPEAAVHVITRAVIDVQFQDRTPPDDTPLDPPRVRGRIDRLVPSQVHVPLPHARWLLNLRHNLDGEEEDDPAEAPAAYAVTVSWGENYAPWIRDAQLLDAGRSTNSRPNRGR